MQARILFLFTLLCAAVAGLQSLHAAIITVTTLNDSGAGSLRQALADATDGDTINFSVSGTIRVTSDQLSVNANIVIDGPGADMLAVNGRDRNRVFYISWLKRSPFPALPSLKARPASLTTASSAAASTMTTRR